MELQSFAEVAKRYRVVFFDAFGVLKNSSGLLPGVLEMLAWLASEGTEYFLITNDSSRSPARLSTAYHHPTQGSLIPASRVVSSGLLAKDYFRHKIRKGKVAYLGGEPSAFYIESAGLTAVPVAECTPEDNPQAFALLDDEGFDWFRDINQAVNLVRKLNIPVVVANTDAAYPVNDTDVAIAVGSLATMMEGIIGKTFTRFGKPDPMMFSYGFAAAHSNIPKLKKSEVLMVGDTLQTDIHGANTFGIDTALVLSGNTAASRHDVLIRASGIIPDYVCESVLT